MQSELERALALVLGDLARTGGPTFTVRPADEGTVWLLEADGSGIGLTYDDERSLTFNAHRFAQAVQDAAIEASGRAWPECPAHPDSHPLWVSWDGKYTCPQTGTVHGVVGALGKR